MASVRLRVGTAPAMVARLVAGRPPFTCAAAGPVGGLNVGLAHGPLLGLGICHRQFHPTRPLCKAKEPRPAKGAPRKEAARGVPKSGGQAVVRPAAPSPPPKRKVVPPKPPPPPPRPGQPSSKLEAKQDGQRGDNKTKQSLPEILAKYRVPFFGAVVSGVLFMAYISYLLTVFVKTAPKGPVSETEAPTGLPPGLTRATAAEFDSGLDYPEWLMGIKALRRRMAEECTGHVLEVAVGTGRNVGFYDWDDIADVDPQMRTVRRIEKQRYRLGRGKAKGDADVEMASYTGVDVSADALEVARSNIRKLVPGLKERLRGKRPKSEEQAGKEQFDRAGAEEYLSMQDGRLRLIRADAEKALPLPPQDLPPSSSSTTPAAPPQHYDVVIQNFGLCSVADPRALLANMAGVVKPDTGRILLLEHGRSGTWQFVNRLIDAYAPEHFARFGCWWNRDIEGIVRGAAAAVPGLEVVSVESAGRMQFGTTLLIELRVSRKEEEKKGNGGSSAETKQEPSFGLTGIFTGIRNLFGS